MTPSAVSAAIHALESRYGIHLFNRVGRRIELSQTGRLFLAEAKATQRSARNAELALVELGGLGRGTLTIQASQTIASYWLPPYLVRFKATYAAIGLVLRQGNSADVATAVLDGTVDLGFVEGDIEDPALTLVRIARDRLVVVAAPDHPLTKRRKVLPKDLIEATWILREAGSGTRSVFETALKARDINPELLTTVLEVPSNEAACVAVVPGHISPLSRSWLLVLTSRPSASRLSLSISVRESFSLIRHKQRHGSKASEAFESLLPQI